MLLLKTLFLVAVVLVPIALRGEIKVANVAVEFPSTGAPLINGEWTEDLYFDELKDRADIVILRVKPVKLAVFDRWKLWQKGFREADVVLDGVLLRDDAHLLFVRAPVGIEAAWKSAEVQAASHPNYKNLLLQYGRLDVNTKLKRFYWDFVFGLKGADGGVGVRVDLTNGNVEVGNRP